MRPNTISLDIRLEGDAFADAGGEVSRILRDVAVKLSAYIDAAQLVDRDPIKLYDANGNPCGHVLFLPAKPARNGRKGSR